jgi:glycosidase
MQQPVNNMSKILPKLKCLLAAPVIASLIFNPAVSSAAESSTPGAHKSPDWLRSSVVYELYPRDFSPAGDFNGITARLDELKDLGVDILWLMPIHPIGQKFKKGSIGSPYCVRDFYAINPDYGTADDFKRLLAESHNRNMKVLIDLVAGHTAWDSVLMAHPEYYVKDANGHIIPPNTNWVDVAKLNYDNPELRQYMIGMMKHWVQDFGVDGFRCDVAYTVPVDFWEAARVELEKVNPNVIILAEAGAKPLFLSKAFDVDSSWNLYSSLDSVMQSVLPASLLKQSWEHTQKQFPEGVLHLRYSDNHHQPRAVSRYGIDGALAAQVLILTLDGLPLFYNGMEVGDATESTDPALFEKMPVFWHPDGRPPLRDIYRDLIKLRKKYPAFYNGEVVWAQNSAPESVVSLLRRDAKDEFLVLINLSSRGVTGSVELADTSGFAPVKISGMPEPLGAVVPDFRLSGYGWFIYHRSLSK